MICLDQPNRRMRTRMSGGVGGGLRDGAPYPVIFFIKSSSILHVGDGNCNLFNIIDFS